ncbi:small secreted protein [Durotheca rogersii]|uniref:small secreted protein n=1 Tax=Durotheca rogersii TaxID=419775 RepID=UPI0022202D87|nr:small secreted protein [Durotheca rogersii]KAI5866071.1 small secreted protein [Durotheca rogersii]
MQLTNILVSALLAAGSAVAAPVPEAVSAMAAVPEWTIESLQRVCDAADDACTWSFGINTHLEPEPATPCSFVARRGARPASQSDTVGNACGRFTVSSGWSDYFGPDNGFTTLSVVDYAARLIVWPAYTDQQLADGRVVSPDLSFAPATLA